MLSSEWLSMLSLESDASFNLGLKGFDISVLGVSSIDKCTWCEQELWRIASNGSVSVGYRVGI